jgi:hypothetical protein
MERIRRYINVGLWFASIATCAYGLNRLNHFDESLDRNLDRINTASVIPLCGEDYKENAQLAREMGYSKIAEKIEQISKKTLDKLRKESELAYRP